MKPISVPETVAKRLSSIASLTDEQFAWCSRRLQTLEVNGVRDLKVVLTEHIDANTARDISGLIENIYLAAFHRGQTVEEFLRQFFEAIDRDHSETVKREKLPEVKSRLTDLINLRPLALSFKGRFLAQQYPKVFDDAQILSDIRPVFDPFSSEPTGPDAVVISHNLRLDYWESGEFRQAYFVLSFEDLERLGEHIKRARQKVALIKSLVERSDIAHIETSIT